MESNKIRKIILIIKDLLREKSIIVLRCIICMICVITIFNVYQSKKFCIMIEQEKVNGAYKHLFEKYGEELEFNLLDYSIMDGFRANFNLSDNSDIKFSVVYLENKEQYSDNYLQMVLTNEVNEFIALKLSEANLYKFDYKIGTLIGPPFDLSTRLYGYYKSLGRYPQIKDMKTYNEKFSHITLYFNNLGEDEKALIKSFIKNLDLPVQEIRTKDAP